MVESFRLSYGGLCLSTTSVPPPSDLSRMETFVCTLIPKGSSVRCKVPSLRSFCKLIGVPFLCGGNPINSKNASFILASSVYKDSIRLATPPRIVCDSRQADTCTIYFNIWDSQTGSQMKSFVDHSLNVGNVVCFFCKASMKSVMAHTTKITTTLLQLAAKATPSRSPLFPPLLIENLVPTSHFVRIAANLMPLTPLISSSGNIVLTVSGLWNDMQRWMSSDLMCILLLEKPVPAAKPWLQEVLVKMVGRHKPIWGDLNLFSVQDYPCRYGLCPVACNVIKFGVCSYMSNFLFASILSSGFDFSCYYSVYALSH